MGLAPTSCLAVSVETREMVAASRRRLPGARLDGEAGPHVVEHRVLHRDLQPPPLAGSLALEQRAQDRHRDQDSRKRKARRRPGPLSRIDQTARHVMAAIESHPVSPSMTSLRMTDGSCVTTRG